MTALSVRLALRAIRAGMRVPSEERLLKYIDNARLADLLARMRIDCVIDVGANCGQFAERIRGMGFTGQIVSFEPIAEQFALLEQAFAGDRRWRGFNCALGSAEEVRDFNVVGSGSETLYSSFLPPLADATPAESHAVAMTVRTLDGVFPEIEAAAGKAARYFLKLDTQGFDLEVCRGGKDCLPRMLGLLSEISVQPLYEGQPRYIDALEFYDGLGFALMDMSVVNRTASGGVMEYDCLMARPEALASTAMERN